MKRIIASCLAALLLAGLTACGGAPKNEAPQSGSTPAAAAKSGVEDGVLTIALECAYAPYNWTQTDDANGAVPISNGNPGEYANGYDVMMAKKLCEANGWKLEVQRMEWGALVPAVVTGQVDAVIAGQSMTAERMQEVDFAGPYLYATIICLVKADGPYANATGISDLAGGTCTSQLGTIWYDTCLPQVPDAKIQAAASDAPAMLMALETGNVQFVVTDMPTAQGAVAVYPDLKILNFEGTAGDFQFENVAERDENVNIGISLRKGNEQLKTALDGVLSKMTKADFDTMMAEAIAIQPITQG